MAISYGTTGKGYILRCGPALFDEATRMDLADCWARYRAMTADPIILARGAFGPEADALRAAVATEWGVLLDAGKARQDPPQRIDVG